ncbi:MAG TPA: PDDEXK nuclease domain-containing protein [bacterium]|nr:PDDEXK nuclease domain-containing protein [bacterium]
MELKDYSSAIRKIKDAILQSRYTAAALANRELLSLYFSVGRYVSENTRNRLWGTGAIEVISERLQQELPGLRGFSTTNIKNMRLFYESWEDFLPNRQLTTDDLRGELFTRVGFTHHMEIILKVKGQNARLFYVEQCATGFWSVEKLKYHIKENLFSQKGALQNNFTKTIPDQTFRAKTLHAFKGELLLDFVNIEDPDEEPDERVLEHAIVNNIKKFIMALGSDFSFVGNQYRLLVDGNEFFIDLLFFNRRLQSLVALELKKGKFKAEYAGKMNFYLSALDELIKMPHENPSIGIILCKEKNHKIVEFSFRDTSKPMGVALYKTSAKLPAQYRNILPDAEKLKRLL